MSKTCIVECPTCGGCGSIVRYVNEWAEMRFRLKGLFFRALDFITGRSK